MTEIREEAAENESKKTAEGTVQTAEKAEKKPAGRRKASARKTAAKQAVQEGSSETAESVRGTSAKKRGTAAKKTGSGQASPKKPAGPRDGIYTELPIYLL